MNPSSRVDSCSTFVVNCFNFCEFFLCVMTRNFMRALSIGMTCFSCGINSTACCFEVRFGFTEKWTCFMHFSIILTGYGLLVSGFTHLSAMIVAMSRNEASSWCCLSFSLTCNSPFSKIYWYKMRSTLIIIKLYSFCKK